MQRRERVQQAAAVEATPGLGPHPVTTPPGLQGGALRMDVQPDAAFKALICGILGTGSEGVQHVRHVTQHASLPKMYCIEVSTASTTPAALQRRACPTLTGQTFWLRPTV